MAYLCARISSGQGENPDRRYSPRAERQEPLQLRHRQCSRQDAQIFILRHNVR